jgi:hypothetical protein
MSGLRDISEYADPRKNVEKIIVMIDIENKYISAMGRVKRTALFLTGCVSELDFNCVDFVYTHINEQQTGQTGLGCCGLTA